MPQPFGTYRKSHVVTVGCVRKVRWAANMCDATDLHLLSTMFKGYLHRSYLSQHVIYIDLYYGLCLILSQINWMFQKIAWP